MMNEQIRQAIREALNEKKMTQVELAKETGLRPDYVSKVLRGDSADVPDSWGRIFKALGLKVIVIKDE